tara:strand:+ start:918 stop:1370 length:453 start_codon:yes stop_codon:yes gene_type:complete
MTTAAGISHTTVSTSQLAPLGFELEVPTANAGMKVYIYVENDSGAALIINRMQTRKAGSATYQVAQSGAANPVTAVGVAEIAIPNGSFGFLLRKGHGVVDSAATVNPNLGLTLIVGGEVLHGAATVAACGNTLAGRTGAGTFTAFLNCQG